MAKKQRKKGKAAPPLRFAVGDKVRVRPGVTDPDFPDIPWGGWVGKVEDIAPEQSPPTFLVAWNLATLKQMHPVFRQRCERDGLDPERMWLTEEDLETYDGSPVVVEQVGQITPRPLNPDDREDRIRAIFGLTSDEDLPLVSYENSCWYHQHLTDHMSFPFPALIREYGPPPVTGTGFLALRLLPVKDLDDATVLVCEVRRDRRPGRSLDACNQRFDVLLGAVEPTEGGANRQLIDDYTYWADVYTV